MKTLFRIKENWRAFKSLLKLKLDYIFSDDFLFVEGGEDEMSECPEKFAIRKEEAVGPCAEFQLNTG